jgi:hypothetical protein
MFQSTRWRLPVNLVCRGCVGDDGLWPPAPSFTTCWSLARNGSLVRLSPIVDTVNTRLARGIEIEEHPPLSHAQPVQSFPIRESLHITVTNLTIAGQGEQNPHCGVSVQASQVAARGGLPDEGQSPNSLSTSLWDIPGDGWSRARSIRANKSASTGAS